MPCEFLLHLPLLYCFKKDLQVLIKNKTILLKALFNFLKKESKSEGKKSKLSLFSEDIISFTENLKFPHTGEKSAGIKKKKKCRAAGYKTCKNKLHFYKRIMNNVKRKLKFLLIIEK